MSTTATASADKLQCLFESFKLQQHELERLEKDIYEKKELKSRRMATLTEISILVDERVSSLQDAKMENCRHLEYSKNLKSQIEREKSIKCSTYLNLVSYEGCLTKKENERVAASLQNARVLRDLTSQQFHRRKEFKDMLLAALLDGK